MRHGQAPMSVIGVPPFPNGTAKNGVFINGVEYMRRWIIYCASTRRSDKDNCIIFINGNLIILIFCCPVESSRRALLGRRDKIPGLINNNSRFVLKLLYYRGKSLTICIEIMIFAELMYI